MIATEQLDNGYDVIIVGAGISGINFAYRLQTQNPELSFTILEGRDNIGGTWDLFKYPGLRSDSDLYTFGFSWRPWTEEKAIAEGPLIINYVKESAAMYGIDQKVKFRHKVSSANWSSEQQAWSLSVDANGQPTVFRGRFMLLCTGYYDYNQALPTVIPGIENFKGKTVHPQFWPEDLDYTGQNIVIIGSGATAVTLLPALAETASHVTMLQRSPSYLLSQPKTDGLEILIRNIFPKSLAHKLIRIKWITATFFFTNFCRYFPDRAKGLIREATIKQLPPSISHDPHFQPAYNPFEQRVCFCPEGDFYVSLRSGKSSVVTGHIDTVTENSIKLTNGRELHPDIIVTATGLKIQLAGGMKLTVDNAPFKLNEKFIWKGVMLQDLPNAAFVVGYVDASWTLGANATAFLICRILNRMKKEGTAVVVPRLTEEEQRNIKEMPMLNLSSTYVQKAKDAMPKAGDAGQWRPRRTYMRDIWEARFGNIRKGLQHIKGPV
jgi:cation diffusion facilitator CzcD-associated flavoprotein CzcO